jgi:hypothetical protein
MEYSPKLVINEINYNKIYNFQLHSKNITLSINDYLNFFINDIEYYGLITKINRQLYLLSPKKKVMIEMTILSKINYGKKIIFINYNPLIHEKNIDYYRLLDFLENTQIVHKNRLYENIKLKLNLEKEKKIGNSRYGTTAIINNRGNANYLSKLKTYIERQN